MKTKNFAVGILVGLLTLALWYQYLLKPTRAQASKARADTATERAKLAPLQHQLDQARAAAANKGSLDAHLASLELAVPDSPALSAWIRDADGIAVASGVTWQSVTHAPPVIGVAGVETIAVGIQLKGTYGAVVDYITRLAGLRRLLVVDSVQLTTSGGTGAAAAGATGGGSTGPFSGADALTATITARMFTTADTTTAAGSAPGGGTTATAPAGGQTSTLNNS